MLIPELTRIFKAWLDFLLTALGVVVYHFGLARFVIGLNPRAPRILMYHACEEAESDFIRGLSINTTPACLAAQLDFLQTYYRVVPLDSLGDGSSLDRATVVITFDDGFRSVYEHALPLLLARNLPATCYLVTDLIDAPGLIWINELNGFLRRHGNPAKAIASRRLGISRHCSMPVFLHSIVDRYEPRAIADLLSELRAALAPMAGMPGQADSLHLGRDEIEEMSRSVFTFGNHTASHAVLSRLGEAECREQIRKARDVLGGLPGTVESLAYPFGRFDEETRAIAQELGYTTLMEVEGDNTPFDRSHAGRVNVGSDSPAVLFARIEVVARIKPMLKRFLKSMLRRTRG